jgi:hypothetical protein
MLSLELMQLDIEVIEIGASIRIGVHDVSAHASFPVKYHAPHCEAGRNNSLHQGRHVPLPEIAGPPRHGRSLLPDRRARSQPQASAKGRGWADAAFKLLPIGITRLDYLRRDRALFTLARIGWTRLQIASTVWGIVVTCNDGVA